MDNGSELYLIDSNSLITAYRLFYSFDIAPSFWKKLSEHFISGKIVISDMVKNELEQGNDSLTEWLRNLESTHLCNHVDSDIISTYGNVIQYVHDCGLYKESAFRIWSVSTVADPWLIASASVNNYTLVTFEEPSGGLNPKNPNKAAKIPDVARHFNVKVINLFEMMRRLKIIL